MRSFAALLLVGAAAFSGAQAAGRSSCEAQVAAKAIQHVFSELARNEGLPEGPIHLDPRRLTTRTVQRPASADSVRIVELGDEAGESLNRAVSDLTGADVVPFEQTRVCTSANPRDCTLRGAVAAFATSQPTVRDSTAEVYVRAMWRSEAIPRQPVGQSDFRVRLVRKSPGAEWTVESAEVVSIIS